ncbi:MAG: YegS/Rv2252/BmrU family lipid kinase [Bdellovibrionota bacterium]|nr:YegS/Rv2252/BmrU family lipid kinase [Bdellovibrionota bacterium]
MKRVSVLANEERQRSLRNLGLEFTGPNFSEITFEEHLNLKDLSLEKDIIVVAGGDGSLNYALKKLDERKLTNLFSVYYIPMGTANDFSRFFELDKDRCIEKLKAMKFGDRKDLYFASLDEQVLVNMASCGIFGDLTPEVPEEMKSVFGTFSYYLKALEILTDRKCFSLRMNVDGEKYDMENVLGFFIGNSKFAGGGVSLTKDASPGEDKLDLLVIKEGPTLELVGLALDMQFDEKILEDSRVFYRKFRNLKVSASEEIPLSVDGESMKKKDFEVSLSPNQWHLLS